MVTKFHIPNIQRVIFNECIELEKYNWGQFWAHRSASDFLDLEQNRSGWKAVFKTVPNSWIPRKIRTLEWIYKILPDFSNERWELGWNLWGTRYGNAQKRSFEFILKSTEWVNLLLVIPIAHLLLEIKLN